MADLIAQGYSESELLERFKKTQKAVRPAVEKMQAEAERAVASESRYATYDEIKRYMKG